MILSCRRDQYSRLDTLNIKIRPLFQNLLTFLIEAKHWEKKLGGGGGGGTQNLIHIEEDSTKEFTTLLMITYKSLERKHNESDMTKIILNYT